MEWHYLKSNPMAGVKLLKEPPGRLRYLEPEEFYETYPVSDTNTASVPDHFTVDAGVIYVAPVGATSIYVAFEKKLMHLNSGGSEVVGPMSADLDYPVWDAVFHYYLVLGAIATGVKRENDPTFQPLEDEFGAGMIVMREELLPPDAP